MPPEYDLELDRVVEQINHDGNKMICIQLPDGLKPEADTIKKEIETRTAAKVIIWAGSCWGGCDVPFEVKRLGVDLLIQWGHSEWEY